MAGRRRSRSADEDDSVSGSDSDSDSDVRSDGSGHVNSIRRDNGKRARIERRSPSQPSDVPVLPDSYRSTAVENGTGEHSTSPAHQPGSIVRVALQNFVTYTAAEFHPGPSLNMVIGPNGTGKSTLVCAICLGLGSKPETLGRAKDISEYIKHGARTAEIEIELAADPQRHASNPVVKRIIKKDKTTWFIDGRPATQKAVLTLCRSFSIQIDNLCQFLPQDRVVEFAGLSPVELLTETQRAAAPEHMTAWHEELKKLRRQQRESLDLRKADAESLKNLEGRQTLQRADVDRLRERAEIQTELKARKRLRPFPLYRAARNVYMEARESRKQAEDELKTLRDEVEPALQAANMKQNYVAAIQKVVDQRDRLVKRMEVQADDMLEKQKSMLDQIQQCDNEVTAEKDAVRKAKQERLRLEGLIKDMNRQLSNSNEQDFDVRHLNEPLRDVARRIREKEELDRESRTKHDEVANRITSRKQKIDLINRDLDSLRSKAGQQANKLRSFSKDTAAAWDWICANKNRFSGNVLGPALITCSLKNQSHAKAFEALVGQADIMAITVTNVADYNMLQQEVFHNLRLTDINLRSVQRDISSWTPPVSNERLKDLGLHCWVLELIDGPPEVLSMLCDTRSIHQIAMSERNINDDQYKELANSAISSWVTPSESYQITRRKEYGDQGTSTRMQSLRPAKFFTNQPVDTHEEERLKTEKKELERDILGLQEQIEEYRSDGLRYGQQIKEMRSQQKELNEEKAAKQKALADYKKLQPRLELLQSKLTSTLAEAASYRVRVQAIKDRQEVLVLQRGEDALKLMARVTALQKLQTDLFEAELLVIEAQSDFEVMEARNADIHARLERAQQETDRLRQVADQLKTNAKHLQDECNVILRVGLTPQENELNDRISNEDTSPEDWEAEIEATVARLEMVHEGNPRIIEEYEARAKEIERITGKLARLETGIGQVEAKITEVRAKWEPELDQLVGQISEALGDNFARIGCAGEVQVAKDEEFERWAINILVRFRESEQLSILDSHRQSGGERAVSTIFYLMALQSLARAPFRVVDEINQGMDPRNERMVHERIVDIACAKNTSQYFLITPKLLPNLKYHPNMKVHCVASGEYMPSNHVELDFRAIANRALVARGKA